ncbi:transketolase [uncultured Cohaesibacter sp.]|uniref:transketolase n=1 Tax=uncultured Cohaesibacter sp. TaxID=1002546 RepID=UPI0029C8061B|nr:transketolase [uncultured Cohaesibacter sp.]
MNIQTTATKSIDMKAMANAVRFLSMDAIVRADDGHPGTPLGGADIATALFTRHLKFDPKTPTWPDRDRFVHSAGHGSMLIYSLLHLSGYEELGIDQVRNFRVLGSNTPGHPEFDTKAGIETTTGPLGQGIGNAVGMAIAERMLNHRFGDDLVDHRTYAYVGDGCLMEGIAAEVIALAGHLKLGKLTFLWDDNRMTDDGVTTQAVSEDQVVRFKNNGWHVQEVDGHDPEAVAAAIAKAKEDDRPSMIACRTLIGFGIPRIQNDRVAHGGKITKDDTDAARENLGWTHAPFEIPDELYASWHLAGESGAKSRLAWQERYEALSTEDRAEFDRLMAGKLPEGWQQTILEMKKSFTAKAEDKAGIRASGEMLSALADTIPELICGAPDLEAATQHKRQLAPFTHEDRGGRYIHYGVREHAMGAIMNGMTVHGGLVASGTTFFVFSDYMRHTLRMAAMMEIPSIFIFSHDSIGIGKNGPTHQPVEALASLRAYPNMWTIRPADAVEMAEAWQLALEHRNGPTSIICSRQPLSLLRTDASEENRSARGAYILADAEGGVRRATLFATGSEVAVAMGARALLQAKGVPTAVVSMPSWELFEAQDEAYREEIIGRDTVRVAVEAAVRLGWDRYIGEKGGFVGMKSFGASGDYPDLFRHFGITAEAVAGEVEQRL